MNKHVPAITQNVSKTLADILIRGDLGKLTEDQRLEYMMTVCDRVGIDYRTSPFQYIVLQGRTVLYARKDATDQLRARDGISVVELTESERDGVFIVTAKVQNNEGRTDVAKGAVTINGLKGEALANALMKAETKAKRRATLSICGLGLLDETEVDELPEKLTNPPAAPKFSRAADAATTHNNNTEAMRHELEICPTVPELDATAVDIEGRQAYKNLPQECKDLIAKSYAKTLDALTGQVVIDEVQEPKPTISERAIAARERVDLQEVDPQSGVPKFLARKRDEDLTTDEVADLLRV